MENYLEIAKKVLGGRKPGTPERPIIEKSPETSLTKLTEPAEEDPFVSSVSSVPKQNQKIGTDDPYRLALQGALGKMVEYPTPPAALLWASLWRPADYDAVTLTLPNQVHELWTAAAPMQKFNIVLGNLVATHKRICREFSRWREINPLSPETPARAVRSDFRIEGDGDHVCTVCGGRFRTFPGWRAHVSQGRCEQKEVVQ